MDLFVVFYPFKNSSILHLQYLLLYQMPENTLVVFFCKVRMQMVKQMEK